MADQEPRMHTCENCQFQFAAVYAMCPFCGWRGPGDKPGEGYSGVGPAFADEIEQKEEE